MVGSPQFGDVLQVLGHGVGDVVEEQVLVERAVRAAFGRGAVVGHQDDQRVVELVHLFEERDQLADVVIDVRQVRRVHFHLRGRKRPSLAWFSVAHGARPDRAATASCPADRCPS